MHGFLPLVSASDPYHEFGSQLWSQGLSIDDFLAPLVIKGDQQARSYLLKPPLQRPDLGRSETPRIETLQLLENVDPSPFGVSSEPGGDLIPQALIGVRTGAPVTRPSTFLILAFSCLFKQRGRSARNTIHRDLFPRTLPDFKLKRRGGMDSFECYRMPPQGLL